MGLVVVEGAIIKCTHGGQLQLSGGDSRLAVNSMGIIASGKEAGLTFGSPTAPAAGMLSPCMAQTPTPPPVFVPCVTTPSLPSGLARKLTVGNLPVLLDSAGGPTVSGAGPGKWSVSSAGQNKLVAS